MARLYEVIESFEYEYNDSVRGITTYYIPEGWRYYIETTRTDNIKYNVGTIDKTSLEPKEHVMRLAHIVVTDIEWRENFREVVPYERIRDKNGKI